MIRSQNSLRALRVLLPQKFRSSEKKLTTLLSNGQRKEALDNLAEQSAFFYCADLFQCLHCKFKFN